MWYSLDKKRVIEELKTSEEGLSNEEASARLKEYGKNELKQTMKVHPILIFLEQFKSLFILILLAAVIFSLVIKSYLDAGVIGAIILINSAIGFFQQFQAEKTILKMKQLMVPKVKVLRNNIVSEISSAEVVPGDIVIISEGDKIIADCRILSVNELQADESVLTGESMPIDKSSEKISVKIELAERNNMLYAGTIVVRGNAKAVVVSTGMNTEFGRIAGLVQGIREGKTPLQKKLDIFSGKVAVIALVLATITAIVGIAYGQEIFEMILTGVALAVSVIPEGLPAVISIALAFGIKTMQKYKALVRRLPAAETLGRTTVICTDKTGTLTEEEMSVTDVYCGGQNIKIEDDSFFIKGKKISPEKNNDLLNLMKTGIMCNNARLEIKGKKLEVFGDPTEKAFVLSAYKAGFIKEIELKKEPRIKEYAFSSSRKMMSIVRKKNGNLMSYVKGAPDIVLRRCTKELINGRFVVLSDKRRAQLLATYTAMASDALRVLAFACKEISPKFNQEIAENGLVFLGFQGMLDVPRKEVRFAIKECRNAGIKIKMITGDSVITARAIAQRIGLGGDSIEMRDIENLPQEEFDRMVVEKTIFARITPEIKLRIIQSLKKMNEIVAVTGDGVNDVLALKEAHIGISMGIRGTDVARDVSDMILLDDNFNTIIEAVKEGRRVYDNIKKAIKFNLSANIDELLVVLVAILLSLPIPLLPLAILWMNLITDSLPSLALTMEKEEPNIMKRKPLNPKEDILKGIFKFSTIAGFLSAFVTIILFLIFYQADLDKARTIAITTSVFSELFLVISCRSENEIVWKIKFFSNKYLILSVLAASALQIIAIYTPISSIFGFKALSIPELLIAIGAGLAGFLFFEIVKFFKIKV